MNLNYITRDRGSIGMGKLDPVERTVIAAAFKAKGIGLSHEDTGLVMNYSRSAIFKIERAALAKIRRVLERAI